MKSFKILKQTPSQTAGPFLHIGCLPYKVGIESSLSNNLNNLVLSKKTKGLRINISGKIFDGENKPINDAMLEIWQADSNGVFKSDIEDTIKSNQNFNNWGRTSCDFKTGVWSFSTIKPGPVILNKDKILAPHIWIWIVARGINSGLFTCMFFDDEKKLNEMDCNLRKIKENINFDLLFATKLNEDNYEFNIYLQGDKETIFFDI